MEDYFVTAPEDGEVCFVFEAKHAVGFLTDSGISLLIHVEIRARPAGMLGKEAKKYGSKDVILANGKSAEASKLMAVMGLGVKCVQTAEAEITGDDADAAYEGIKAFFEVICNYIAKSVTVQIASLLQA